MILMIFLEMEHDWFEHHQCARLLHVHGHLVTRAGLLKHIVMWWHLPMQGVGQSVAWSQYLKYSGGKLLSQLCLEEPNPTRSGHLAVPPLLEDGEDGGGKIEDAKDEDKKRTTGRAEQGRHGKETKSWKAKQLFIGRCRKWELFECSLLIFLFFLWSLQETLCHLSKLMSFSQPPSLISDF